MSLPELLIKARNMKYRHGLDMICIDYIQRIGIDTTKKGAPQTRAEQLAYISKTITKLADETFLDMPIIVGAQLNRGADGRRPGIADIKGSGAIEEDADAIIMPYRENFSDDLIELIVGVNKITGRTGTVEARINPVSTKIENKGW
jgi:replicative DNA helicase